MEARAAAGAGLLLLGIVGLPALVGEGAGLDGTCPGEAWIELVSPEPGEPPRLLCRARGGVAPPGCDRVLVPAGIEALASESGCSFRPAPASATVRLLLGRPVDVNRARPEELERLPGIGPGLARRIVADRALRGPFAGVADLRRVKGIGPSRIRELRGWTMASRADVR